MLEVEDAQRMVLERVHPLPAESVPLRLASGRILANSVRAPIDLPFFDNSAMDGFAVRAEDVTKASHEVPATLRMIGRTAAGEAGGLALQPKTCVRVFTGSALPTGTTAVVMQEDTQPDPLDPGLVRILDAAKPWENVRLRGEDIKAGENVFAAGEYLNAQKVGLAAALGLAELKVHKKPVVGLVATGNELAEPGANLFPGQIFESNRACLASLLDAAGAIPRIYPIVRDEPNATRLALKKAFEECDALVSTGGVSVGEHDYVKAAFEELGGKLLFWKVAMKPGKPFVFGEWQEKLLFGLPGNPVSAFATFLLLVRPVVLKFQGASTVLAPRVRGILREPLENHGDRRHFMRVYLDGEGNVASAGPQASHVLGALAKANAIVDVPPRSTLAAGTAVSLMYIG
jgi:molybdopterin molybdotransferase